MRILKQEYPTVNVGKLEIMRTNLHYSKLDSYKESGEHYFNLSSILKISEQLEEEGAGFRIPTPKDFAYLADLGYRWVEYNEVGNNITGCIFGEKAHEIEMTKATQLDLISELALKNCVFLPALGFYTGTDRTNGIGGVVGREFAAYYWSNSAYILYFRKSVANVFNTTHFSKDSGLSVRCVRDIIE